MKRRIIFGLASIFAVVLVGGGMTSILMEELSQLDSVHIQMENLNSRINEVHIRILETVRILQGPTESESRFRRLTENIMLMSGTVKTVLADVSTGKLTEKGCGTCHADHVRLTSDLKDILHRYEESFDNFNMLSTLLITRGEGVDVSTVMEDLNRSTEEMISLMSELDTIISTMLQHSFDEVRKNLTRLNHLHDGIIVVTSLIILVFIIIMFQAVAKPVKLLSSGTEAIVKGDYDFRINLEGKDEMAVLAERFNYMAEVLANRERSLQQKKRQLEELNTTLDRKVRDRTISLREKQEELNRKYLELESANEELQASYIQLETTAAELQEAQAKLQENYNVLKKMNDELRRANEVKNRFLAIMSHELRTPLTIINGYMSLVLEKDYGKPSPELLQVLKVVKEQGKNQLHLIEDLLDLTRIESGEFRLHRQPVNPAELFAKVVENFKPRLEEKKIRLTLDLENNLPASYWDFQKMLQVFQNLLDNSLKFTPATGWIAMGARTRGDFIECRMSDNGIGIPKEKINHIFDRFYQVDTSATRRFGGVGLGLSIVREIILAHNGKIFVESEEGKGTTFYVLMPYGTLPKEAPTEPSRLVASSHLRKGHGEMVLVVDDDKTFLEMMRTVLPGEGYRIATVSESKKVVSAAIKSQARVILLDLMMPEMDGYEVCRRLRKTPETANIPVIILSASGGDEVVRRVFEAGADDYLIKPFSNEEVMGRIADFVMREDKGKGAQGDEGQA